MFVDQTASVQRCYRYSMAMETSRVVGSSVRSQSTRRAGQLVSRSETLQDGVFGIVQSTESGTAYAIEA